MLGNSFSQLRFIVAQTHYQRITVFTRENTAEVIATRVNWTETGAKEVESEVDPINYN